MPTNPLPIAVLISGTGRSLRNLIEHIASGRLDIQIRLVISSDPQAVGLQHAQTAKIPFKASQQKDCTTSEAFSDSIFQPCRDAHVQLVAMAGFMKHVLIPVDFQQRVVNIHPALIPAFCGKGFYGSHVHQAVLDYGAKVTGCTVHFVDDQYDHGPIILQRTVPVSDDDTLETLADRVFQEECLAYPQALQLLAHRRVRVEGRRVHILRPGEPSPAGGGARG